VNQQKTAIEMESSSWFQPDVNETTKKILLQKRPEVFIETKEEKFERMSKKALEERERIRKLHEQVLYWLIDM
jgi:hypothetical protein